jgi:hypothetical protein
MSIFVLSRKQFPSVSPFFWCNLIFLAVCFHSHHMTEPTEPTGTRYFIQNAQDQEFSG